MNIIFGLDQLVGLPHCVLTVGNFDGVHVGHQEILRRAKVLAVDAHTSVAALTFDPHPLAIVAPAKAPLRLMSIEERVRRLGDAGADIVVVAKSEPALLGLEAEDFVRDVLVSRFHPTHIVEGTTFGFGKRRKGSPELLRQKGPLFGYEVHIVEPVSVPGGNAKRITVSSSIVRQLLTQGNVSRAAICLGRPYAIEGIVVRGAGRGRVIGFPTANLQVPKGQVEPAEGVYAGQTIVGEKFYPSAISIGRAESFNETKKKLEAYLIGFDGDLYGKLLRVEFGRWIRGQQKFDNMDALKEQICRDVESVMKEPQS